MFDIGKRITELRKEKKWSQGDLAKAINASRDMIGKYERSENSPSIEMAAKIADTFAVSLDYLLGKEQFGRHDKEAVNRIQEILKLDEDTRNQIYSIIDTFIRDAKARQAYK